MQQEFVAVTGAAYAVWQTSLSVADLGLLLVFVIGFIPFGQSDDDSSTTDYGEVDEVDKSSSSDWF